jgi:Phosphoglycerate dehydrogenase and related dehydrogenases
MYKIKLLNKISPVGLAQLPKTAYQCAEDMEEPDGIIVRSAAMHDMELPASLKAIARAGAGTNNIPIDKCSEKGIVVFNTPGANANAVKELVICGMLMSARKVYPGMCWVQSLKGQGDEVGKLVEKGKSKFAGPELKGKKLGVIGLGAIGVLVCNAARHFGMEIYGYDPFLSVNAAWNISSGIHHASSLQEIYENCDFISLHLPLNNETRGMINAASINSMKHGVRLLNFARAGLVDTDDLLAALEERQIYVYVTDFPTDELLGHPGVLAIPHLGASTPESEENCAEMAANELREYLENGNIINAVNMPSVQVPRSGRPRIGVVHQNKPNMISQITGVVGENINNLTNNSRGDYAYSLLDIDGTVTDAMVEGLQEIEGVIRINVLP